MSGPETEEDYRDAVLPGARWEKRQFVRCDFTEADLRGLGTQGCTFDECAYRFDQSRPNNRLAADIRFAYRRDCRSDR